MTTNGYFDSWRNPFPNDWLDPQSGSGSPPNNGGNLLPGSGNQGNPLPVSGNFVSPPLQNAAITASTTSESTNWSGAAITASGESFSTVSAQWVVPTVTQVPINGVTFSDIAEWVGIDGYNSSDVCQAGVEEEVQTSANGQTTISCYAWDEWYPAYSNPIAAASFQVNPGNTISVTVETSGAGATTAEFIFDNETTGQTYETSLTAPQGTSLQGDSAEFIVETPEFTTGNQTSQPILADFLNTPVVFSDASATYSNGSAASLSSPNAVSIDMETKDVPGTTGYVQEAYGSIQPAADTVTVTGNDYWGGPTSVSVSGQNFLVGENQSVSISNDFSVSNPNGDDVTEYVFEDLGGGNGHFTVNGVAQSDNTVISVSTANLSTVQYVGGPSPETDTLQVGVYDSTTGTYDWSSAFTASTSTVIQTDLSTSLVQGGNDYFLCSAGTLTGPELQLSGAPVTVGEFSGWVPIGAVETSSGYDVAWKNAGTGQYTVWATNSNGNYLENLFGYVSGNTYTLESIETTFDQDLNGDGTIGPTKTVIATDRSTSLTAVANEYFLYNSGGSGPSLMLNGSPVIAGQFSGWAPIGAVQTSTGYDVAWKNAGTGQYTVWSTDTNGNYISNLVPYVAGNNPSLESLELTFDQNLNGDGQLVNTTIQTDNGSYGTTVLTEVSDQVGSVYYLNNTSGYGPTLMLNGSAVQAGQFSGWAPIDAVQTSTGYDVAWENTGTGQYTVWSTDANGNYVSNLVPYVAGNNPSLESLELTFDQNLNGDGQLVNTTIQTDNGSYGTTVLTEVSDQVGSLYSLNNASGYGPTLMLNGSAVQAGQFSGWAPIGAVQTATGYDVAWKNAGTGQYTVWSTDANGNYISNLTPYVAGNNVTLESLESTFNQDLNGDGVTGVYAPPNSTLQVSQSLSSAATIGAGATLELSAADSGSVTFQASTGMLKLDHPSTFTGTIYGFTGNSTLTGSDQIDLLGINYSTVHDSYSSGVLSISDGSGDSATLDFNGPYSLGSFTLVNDGSGGTIVYDPPSVTSGSPDVPSLGPMMSEQDDILSSDFADGFAGHEFVPDGAEWLYSNTSEFALNATSPGSAGQGIRADASQLDPFSLASFGSNPPPSSGSDNATPANFDAAPGPDGLTAQTGSQFTAGLTTMVSGALLAFHDEWQATMGFAGTSDPIVSNNLALTQLHHS